MKATDKKNYGLGNSWHMAGLLTILVLCASISAVKGYETYVNIDALANAHGHPVELNTNTYSAPLTANLSDSASAQGASDSVFANIISEYGFLEVQAGGNGSRAADGNYGLGSVFMNAVGGAPIADYSDTLTITSATLPNGTPVILRFTLSLFGGVVQDGIATASVTGRLNVNRQLADNPFVTVDVSGQTVATVDVTNQVGGQVVILGGLYASGTVNANALAAGQADQWQITGGLLGAYDSLLTKIDMLTPGAGYTSASGTFYLATSSQPQLHITTTSTNSVVIWWPSSAADFSLQQNLLLNSGGWFDYGGTINDDGTNKSVIISPPSGTLFFRLAQ